MSLVMLHDPDFTVADIGDAEVSVTIDADWRFYAFSMTWLLEIPRRM